LIHSQLLHVDTLSECIQSPIKAANGLWRKRWSFLANVNSCSCSLYVVVRPSLSSVVCRLSSVTFVHPTQAIEIFDNISTPFGTLAICDSSVKILRRSSHGNPSVGGLNQRGVEKCDDFGPFQGYISETVQDRR